MRTRTPLGALAVALLACLLLSLVPSLASAADLPDPLARGPYTPVNFTDPATPSFDEYKVGRVQLQEPNAAGGGVTGPNGQANLQIRGSLYYPGDRSTPAPVIMLVHGNHSSCDTGTAPDCTVFKRNDRGYAYLAMNLASWGYAVISIDQDQLMYYQDGDEGKGMHQRRRYMAATLDAFHQATTTGLGALSDDNNIGDSLVGKLDFSRPIGLMGHSRGGDAVSSFIDYNRTRPAPGRRYDIGGVISVAPVDYERRAPTGVAYMTILPYCDGDVSNLQGARMYERGQYVDPANDDPFIQVSVLGTNHNYFNSVWSADNDDAAGQLLDPACGMNAPTSIRLTGGKTPTTFGTGANTYQANTYTFANRGDGDPALMGDQNKIGLALMAAFFRRYIGGETAMEPYMTGELSAVGDGTEIPASACPTDPTGTRIPCSQYVRTSYFAGASEREDVIRPETDNPLTVSALGTALTGSGFANPYPDDGGVLPKPATTAGGFDWCNPEPDHFAPGMQGLGTLPTATKACPLPAVGAIGGQGTNRESAPVNHSYGLQLALAWDDPVAATGEPAQLSTRVPEADGDLRGLRALAMGAAVNHFDSRNPARVGDAFWNASLAAQDFLITLTDAAGHEATVHAGDARYGQALYPTTGNSNARVHVVLNQIRVPLADFAAQGLDLGSVRSVKLSFGASGTPASGSIQLADVRFQESADGPAAAAEPTPVAAGSGGGAGGGGGGATVTTSVPSTDAPTAASDPAPAPAPAAAPACTDAIAPTVALSSKRITRGRLALAGTAADTGCEAKVSRVSVGLYRIHGKRSTLVKQAAAKGTARWALRFASKLKPGAYRLVLGATDAAGNAAQAASVRVQVR